MFQIVQSLFHRNSHAEVAERYSETAPVPSLYPSRAKYSQINFIPTNNIVRGIFLLYYP